IHLEDGRVSVAVSKALMKPGEVIEIKTPNAVSAIRGTVVIAEVVPGPTVSSTISVLRGLVEVSRLDAGRRVGTSVYVGALQAVTITGVNRLPQPATITGDAARRLTNEFRIVPREVPAAATAPAVAVAMQQAVDDAGAARREAGEDGAPSPPEKAASGKGGKNGREGRAHEARGREGERPATEQG